jgi:GT2 family glycosyltransferase
MSLCRGKYIQAIACDDRLHPDKLEKQLAIFEKSPSSVAVVCSDASLIDREGRPCKPFSFFKRYAVPDNTSRENLFKQILEGNCIPAMAALTRREALLDVGPYDESLEFEDYDMWLRILRKYDFVVTSDATADYRIHGSNLHLSPALCQKYRRVKYQVVRKHLDHPLGREQLRRDLVNMISENSLCPIEVEDLVSMEFNLQEVADLFPYWYRWVRKQGHSVRKRTPLSFLRRAKRLVRPISH